MALDTENRTLVAVSCNTVLPYICHHNRHGQYLLCESYFLEYININKTSLLCIHFIKIAIGAVFFKLDSSRNQNVGLSESKTGQLRCLYGKIMMAVSR